MDPIVEHLAKSFVAAIFILTGLFLIFSPYGRLISATILYFYGGTKFLLYGLPLGDFLIIIAITFFIFLTTNEAMENIVKFVIKKI